MNLGLNGVGNGCCATPTQAPTHPRIASYHMFWSSSIGYEAWLIVSRALAVDLVSRGLGLALQCLFIKSIEQ